MSKECGRLHQIFNDLKEFTFPFNEKEIPKNGIYVLFERGEKAHGVKRIVRIGTHTGEDQLPSRLWQHFVNENKDRSIFRKNVGLAVLNKSKDPYLKIWGFDLTTRSAKEKFLHLVNPGKQKEIEKQVTFYIQKSFSFVVFEVKNKDKRLEMESKMISTVSLCKDKDHQPSKDWLGSSSPKQKIRESGLWQVNELYKEPLSEKDFVALSKILGN